MARANLDEELDVSKVEIFLLNEKNLKLFVHKDEDMRMEPFAKPIAQSIKVSKIFWAGGLASTNNRLHGKMSALAA